MNRYEKLTLTVAILSMLLSIAGTYEGITRSDQAQSTANEALKLEQQSFQIANNYSYVEVTNVTRLDLRLQSCTPIGSSSNVSCSFSGTFNVSFTIIAPQAGTYNVTILSLLGLGQFSVHPVSYFDGTSASIGNATISYFPQLQAVSPVQGAAPISSSSPFKDTIKVAVSGFTLEAPSASIRSPHFYEASRLLALFSFSAFQAPWNNRQRLFIVTWDLIPA